MGPEVPHFCSRKRPEKSSPCLTLFLEFYFCTRWFLEGFGAKTPLLVLESFWLVLGARFCRFLYKLQGVLFAVFGLRCFFGPSLSPSLSAFSSFSSGGRPGRPFFASVCLLAGYRTPGAWTGGSAWQHISFFLSPSVCPGRPPFPSSSAFALSLSLSLFLSFSLSLSFFLSFLHASSSP